MLFPNGYDILALRFPRSKTFTVAKVSFCHTQSLRRGLGVGTGLGKCPNFHITQLLGKKPPTNTAESDVKQIPIPTDELIFFRGVGIPRTS